MKNFIAWTLAVLITLTAVVYQRMTGPTNPKRVEFRLDENEYKLRFPRSLETTLTLENYRYIADYNEVKIKISAEDAPAMVVYYKVYPGGDTLIKTEAAYDGDYYIFNLPSQPPAGKLIYYPLLKCENGEEVLIEKEEGLIVRFKSPVPAWALVPHVLLMFIAMLLANYTAFAALFFKNRAVRYSLLVIITMGVGGLIFGPIVQNYAFGAYWTGWPFGGDLTDNKTLFAFIVWVVAWLMNRKRSLRYLFVIAALVTLLVYSIPHSTAGSEFDHEKGVVVTGRTQN